MKVNVEERGPIICDAGPHRGLWRVDLRGSAYLDDEERATWERAGRLSVQLLVPLDGGRREPRSEREIILDAHAEMTRQENAELPARLREIAEGLDGELAGLGPYEDPAGDMTALIRRAADLLDAIGPELAAEPEDLPAGPPLPEDELPAVARQAMHASERARASRRYPRGGGR